MENNELIDKILKWADRNKTFKWSKPHSLPNQKLVSYLKTLKTK